VIAIRGEALERIKKTLEAKKKNTVTVIRNRGHDNSILTWGKGKGGRKNTRCPRDGSDCTRKKRKDNNVGTPIPSEKKEAPWGEERIACK